VVSLKTGLSLFPKDKSLALKPKERTSATASLADALEQIKNYPEAEQNYQKVLVVFPSNIAAQYGLAKVLKAQNKNPEAISAYQALVQLKSDEPQFFIDLGNIYQREKNLSQAAAAYEKALALNPKQPTLQRLIGDLYLKDNPAKSIPAYTAYLVDKPEDGEVLGALGAAYRRTGQLDQAIATYRKALALKPEDVILNGNIGVVLAENKQFSEATVFFTKAAALNPNDVTAQRNLAINMFNDLKKDNRTYNEKIYRDVLPILDKAIGLDSKDAYLYYLQGIALANIGKRGEASAALEKSLKLDPNNEDLKKLIKQLSGS